MKASLAPNECVRFVPTLEAVLTSAADESQVAVLAFWAQPHVYWVTLPLDERVVYAGNDVATAIRLLTLEDQI